MKNVNSKKKAGPWSLEYLPRLDGKIIVITGANSGIGFESARIFAGAGAHVVMACRNAEKANEAIKLIHKEIPKASVEFMSLDLGSLASVRNFAKAACENLPKINVLCNNAGVMTVPYKNYTKTEDDFEMHFGINHLGHFALTGMLFEKLMESQSSRIVTVSSGAHKIGDTALRFDDEQGLNGYGRSKLANLLFTYELDRRFKARGLNMKAVACHPGATKSNLLNAGPQMSNSRPALWLRLIYLGVQSTKMGALTEIYAAVGEDIKSGDFIGPSGFLESRGLPKKVESSLQSHDPEMAMKLWTLSEKLTGVQFLD